MFNLTRRKFLKRTSQLWGSLTLTKMVFTRSSSTADLNQHTAQSESSLLTKSNQHALTLKEIIATRKVRTVRISPDGTRVAFIVEQAILDHNENRSTIFVTQVETGAEPTKLIEETSLSQLRWTLDGKLLTYVSGRSGLPQVWQINPDGGTPEQLTRLPRGVGECVWSPDMQKIAFSLPEPIADSEREEAKANGIVYLESFSLRDIVNKSWIKKPHQVWIYDLRLGKQEVLIDSIRLGGRPSGLAWSPDGSKLAMIVAPSDERLQSLVRYVGYVPLATGKFKELVSWKSLSTAISWSPNGKSIAFLSEGDIEGKPRTSWMSLFAASLNSTKPVQLTPTGPTGIGNYWWTPDGNSILLEMTEQGLSGLYEVAVSGGNVRKLTQSKDVLYGFSFDRQQRRVACICENSTTPAEVAFFDRIYEAPRTLTKLNPEYKDIRLGKVSFIQWKNQKVNEGNGYLITPLDYVPGHRYPLLVILYGFTGGFISQAQWNPNYPAQVFASQDYAVLLWNPPSYCARYPGYRPGNFEEGSLAEAYGPMESLQNAIRTIAEMGIADDQKCGVMGWSYGSFVTDFTITHSNLFQVASTGEGGLYTPFGYASGTLDTQLFQESMMGGSPYTARRNWIQISSSYNASKVNIPVLMEYTDKSVYALEFYTALKRQGKKVELVFYPDESHIFFQPRHRLASMQRNLDWFNFWLQNREDPHPAKESQYNRWRQMRDEAKNQLT